MIRVQLCSLTDSLAFLRSRAAVVRRSIRLRARTLQEDPVHVEGRAIGGGSSPSTSSRVLVASRYLQVKPMRGFRSTMSSNPLRSQDQGGKHESHAGRTDRARRGHWSIGRGARFTYCFDPQVTGSALA